MKKQDKISSEDLEDKNFNPLYRGNGVFIFTSIDEPDSVFTQLEVNDIGFCFDIPKRDFFRLTKAMNYAIKASKIYHQGKLK